MGSTEIEFRLTLDSWRVEHLDGRVALSEDKRNRALALLSAMKTILLVIAAEQPGGLGRAAAV